MKRKLPFLLLLVSLSCFLTVNGQISRAIYLKSTTLQSEDLIPITQADKGQFQASIFQGKYFVLLQFEEIPTTAMQQEMAQAGIQLLTYQPDFAFYAAVDQKIILRTLVKWKVKGVSAILPSYKHSRSLANHIYPSHAMIGQEVLLAVRPYPNIPTSSLYELLVNKNFLLFPSTDDTPYPVVQLPINAIDRLGALAPVMYLEPIAAPPLPDGHRGRSLHRANLLSRLPGTGYDGTGVTLAIADDGGISHIDFQGRMTDHNGGQGGTHGDMTAGIAVGAGNLDPIKLGMATGVYLHMYGIGGYPHVTNSINNYHTLGTTITSTSYSQGCGGVYNNSARDIDESVDSIFFPASCFLCGK